jgi:protein CpxP
MHKTLIALFFAAALPVTAMAATGDDAHRGHHPAHHGAQHFKGLNLTPEQRQQTSKLMFEQKKSQREITQRYLDKLSDADKKALATELKAAKDKQHKELRALLTPAQQKELDAQQKKAEERRAEHQEFLKWKAEKAKAQ